MDYVHFHCENCNSVTPEMYNAHAQTISNITCIEELRKIINSNLITFVRYNSYCKNCVNVIISELINIYECSKNYYYSHYVLHVRNIKLIEERGLFRISYKRNYYVFEKNYPYLEINEKQFFNSIKIGSLLEIIGPKNIIIDKIKEKFYQVNLIKIIYCSHYYIIERPTMTKPARKNNLSN